MTRQLTVNDVDAFCSMRIKMLLEWGEFKEGDDTTALEAATRENFLKNIGKDLICFGEFDNDELVATVSMNIFNRLPGYTNLEGKEGYLLNVYTRPEYRRRGIAKKLVDETIECAKGLGIKMLWLNASKTGRLVYLKCGFKESDNAMELYI